MSIDDQKKQAVYVQEEYPSHDDESILATNKQESNGDREWIPLRVPGWWKRRGA